jgi:hypothetical protein
VLLESELEQLKNVLTRKRRVALSLGVLEGKETVRLARIRQLASMLRMLESVIPFILLSFRVSDSFNRHTHSNERDKVLFGDCPKLC